VSDVLPERYSVISGVRDILYRHVLLCDILELINSSYSTSPGLNRIEICVRNNFPLFIVFFDIRSFLIFSSLHCFTHYGYQFRSNATCCSVVLLQVCEFSGGYCLKHYINRHSVRRICGS